MNFETCELVNPSTRQLANLQFSIIIPTYKRNDLLTLCLQRLQPGAQSLEASLYEVIVTDDAADAATEQLLLTQFPWARYTAGPQRGPAANRNHGASLATGQWLVFTDDDCLPDAQWLQAYADAIELHPDCKAFEGAILPDDWALLKKDMAECPVNTEGGCFWSANIMITQSLFKQVGGFNISFPTAANEDQALFFQLQKHAVLEFISTAVVKHPVKFIPLHFKLSKLPQSSYSQILLEQTQGIGYWMIWLNGLKIHAFSAYQSIKKHWPKRFIYNCVGFCYRLVFTPIQFFRLKK